MPTQKWAYFTLKNALSVFACDLTHQKEKSLNFLGMYLLQLNENNLLLKIKLVSREPGENFQKQVTK